MVMTAEHATIATLVRIPGHQVTVNPHCLENHTPEDLCTLESCTQTAVSWWGLLLKPQVPEYDLQRIRGRDRPFILVAACLKHDQELERGVRLIRAERWATTAD